MKPISLTDVKECIRWIDPKLSIPIRVLRQWIKKVDILLPRDIRVDQIEYVIAAELRKKNWCRHLRLKRPHWLYSYWIPR